MPLIIDTYNVLHTVGVLPPDLAGIDVRGLMNLLTESRYRQHTVYLICDGTDRDDIPRREGEMCVRFSGTERTADDVIREMVQRSTAPKRLVVVSSDREVARAARLRRARAVSSESFLAQLVRDATRQTPAEPRKPDGSLSRRRIKSWKREFKLDDDLMNIPSAPDPSDAPPDDDLEDVPIDDLPDPGADLLLPPDLLTEAERLIAESELDQPPRPRQRRAPNEASGQQGEVGSSDQEQPSADPKPRPKRRSRDDIDDDDMRRLFPGVHPLDD